MKITKSKLKRIIKEELAAVLEHIGSGEEKISRGTLSGMEVIPRDRTEFSRRLTVVNSELRQIIQAAESLGVWPHPNEDIQQRLGDMLMSILNEHVPRLQEMAHEVGLAWAKDPAGEPGADEEGEEYDHDAPPWGYPETARDPDESTARRYDDEERAIKRAGPSTQMSAKEHEKYMSLYDDDDDDDVKD